MPRNVYEAAVVWAGQAKTSTFWYPIDDLDHSARRAQQASNSNASTMNANRHIQNTIAASPIGLSVE